MYESLKEIDCLQKSFHVIFILSDKVVFMRVYISEVTKVLPVGRDFFFFFNNPICVFCSDQCENPLTYPHFNLI